MEGIDLNKPVRYKHASLRFFEPNEHHVSRFCHDHVLLLVYEGVLRFSEDGIRQDIHAGEYYIQKKDRYQKGELASDSPKYLYVHFDGEWIDAKDALPRAGRFDPIELGELIDRIDTASHQNEIYSKKQYLFLKLLLSLRENPEKSASAQRFCRYIEDNLTKITSLADLCRAFHYSENHIIQIFHKEFGLSPIQYINDVKIKRAMYLLETTSRPIGEIAIECGYADYPYFYKRFLKKNGISPQRWRKQIQENPLHR